MKPYKKRYILLPIVPNSQQPDNVQFNKLVRFDQDGDFLVTPDEGYTSMKSVSAQVRVPTLNPQIKTVNISNNGQITVSPDNNYNCLERVVINTQVPQEIVPSIPISINDIYVNVNGVIFQPNWLYTSQHMTYGLGDGDGLVIIGGNYPYNGWYPTAIVYYNKGNDDGIYGCDIWAGSYYAVLNNPLPTGPNESQAIGYIRLQRTNSTSYQVPVFVELWIHFNYQSEHDAADNIARAGGHLAPYTFITV